MSLGFDCVLSRLSSGLCEGASKLNRHDLERLGRRVDVKCQFQDTLTGLKDKIARKAAASTRPASDASVELYYKAS